MTHQVKLNNCAGCMRKRSLLPGCPTHFYGQVNVIDALSMFVLNEACWQLIVLVMLFLLCLLLPAACRTLVIHSVLGFACCA
jgi:hypothetical protein